jgi:hypothetical protein
MLFIALLAGLVLIIALSAVAAIGLLTLLDNWHQADFDEDDH